MRIRTHAPRAIFFRTLAVALILPGLLAPLAAQPPTREERLLNGLRIFFFQRPGAQKVWMRLRVNSGAAFDLAGKEGMAQLLAGALFPDPSTGQYVAEELGGRLDVRTDYDAIEITISGDASRFDSLTEVLRNALLQMRLTPDEVRRLKERGRNFWARGPRPSRRGPTARRRAPLRQLPLRPRGREHGRVNRARRAGRPDAGARPLPYPKLAARRVGASIRARDANLPPVSSPVCARATRPSPPPSASPSRPTRARSSWTFPARTSPKSRISARGLARSDRDRAAASRLSRASPGNAALHAQRLARRQSHGRHDSHALAGLFRRERVRARRAGRAASRPRAPCSAARSPDDRHRGRIGRGAARLSAAAAHAGRDAEYGAAADWLDSLSYGHAPFDPARAFDT